MTVLAVYLLILLAFTPSVSSNDEELCEFITSVTTLLREVEQMDNLRHNRDRCEFFANRVLAAMRHVYNAWLHLQRAGTHSAEQIARVKTLRDNLKAVYERMFQLPVMREYSYRPEVQSSGERGRPRFLITREQLECLISEFNSWTQIASDLGVSRQTIYNRRRELGFSLTFERYTVINDANLDAAIANELSHFPHSGETNIIAGLRQRGMYVPRWRVREAVIRVDPIGRANRWGRRIVRRPYCVPHSNFLWHMDTNMKLRHWRLCIHGCADGYSRLITYLRVSLDNRAATVLTLFQRATQEWGTPSRVRADDGGENVAVGEYMVWLRGQGRGSFLTGPSVRNTRIERLWRDVGESVIAFFSSIFLFLEARRMLDPDNEIDMFSIHFVFVPRIQRLLDRFTQRFNVHSLSTEQNRTPRQLWVSGFLQNFNSSHTGVSDFFDNDVEDLNMYGDDPDAPPPDPDNEVGVQIVPVSFNVQAEYLEALHANFVLPHEDDNYGIMIYLQVREYVTHVNPRVRRTKVIL